MKRSMLLLFLLAAIAAALSAFGTTLLLARQEGGPQGEAGGSARGLALLGAGVAIGLAGYGAGIGMGTAGAAAVGAVAEKPEVFGRSLIYIVFIEAIAIYGLVVALMILMKVPTL
ncbi:MAG: V-type ATP synthase subunit K [Thermoproteota archaeon]|nr:MAG: V-type ATP synthase subunit K [Candidatus Korarchaeota archaeon]RLG56136.1 MAG: V-type ATP synthase subunit K [Candidatus Korarchaeota archaeon]